VAGFDLDNKESWGMDALCGKVVVITGASRGIGRATALHCARAGAIVGANYLQSTTKAESLLAEAPENIHLLRFDVRDSNAVHESVKKFTKTHGKIDVLVNNAGVARMALIVKGMSLDAVMDQMTTNALGPLHCSQAVLPTMLKQRSGLIINISSVAVERPIVGQTVYAMAKAAIEALSRCIAVEYGAKGIRSVSVRFGPIETEMLAGVDGTGASERHLHRMMADRIADTDEAAQMLCFLMSEGARYANGSCFVLDGGYSLG
jgi:3-oxoacyl-[acyl-carrier protein] reductase